MEKLNEQVNNANNEILAGLSQEEIKTVLKGLTRKYYHYYLSGNDQRFNEVIVEIKNIIDLVESKFPNIHNYLNYILLLNSNQILADNLDSNFELLCFEPDISENETFDLHDPELFERDLELLRRIIDKD